MIVHQRKDNKALVHTHVCLVVEHKCNREKSHVSRSWTIPVSSVDVSVYWTSFLAGPLLSIGLK